MLKNPMTKLTREDVKGMWAGPQKEKWDQVKEGCPHHIENVFCLQEPLFPRGSKTRRLSVIVLASKSRVHRPDGKHQWTGEHSQIVRLMPGNMARELHISEQTSHGLLGTSAIREPSPGLRTSPALHPEPLGCALAQQFPYQESSKGFNYRRVGFSALGFSDWRRFI